MEINKQAIKERLEKANQESEKKKAEYNQLQGIISDCNFWLSWLEKEETKEEPSSNGQLKKLEKVK